MDLTFGFSFFFFSTIDKEKSPDGKILHHFSVLLPSTQLQFGCFCLCPFKIRLSLQSDLAMGAILSSLGWIDRLVQERYQAFPLFYLSPLLSLYVKIVMKLTF